MAEAVFDEELPDHKHHDLRQFHSVRHSSYKASHYAYKEQPSPCNDEQHMHRTHNNEKGILGRIHDIGFKAIFPEPLESVIPEIARAGHKNYNSHRHHCIEHYNTTDSIHIALQSHQGEFHKLLNTADFISIKDQNLMNVHATLASNNAPTIYSNHGYDHGLSHGYANEHSTYASHVAAVQKCYSTASKASSISAKSEDVAKRVTDGSSLSNDHDQTTKDQASNKSMINALDIHADTLSADTNAIDKADCSTLALLGAQGVHLEFIEDETLFADTYVTPGSDNEDLALKAKLLSTLGWRMASVGAETRLIVQSVKKMSHDLGCRNIDLSISRDGIMVKLRRGRNIAVDFKEIKHFAINMDSLSRLHQICLRVSNGSLSDPHQIFLAIRAVRPRHYQHRQLIFIEAIAAGCFAYLNGGNTAVCLSALIGGLFLMYYRFLFIRRGFFESFTFMLCACIGSSVAAFCCHYMFNGTHSNVMLAATASTLLLVPGFPLINGFLDIFKGHVPIGLNRIVIALVLVVSAAVGLLMTSFIYSSITALFG